MEEEDNTIATDISELRTPRVEPGTGVTTDDEVTLDEETRALLAALELDDAQISELASARPSASATSAAAPRSVRSHAKLVQMLLERKQLAHELQLARLDLSQLKLERDRLEAFHSEQLDAQREQMHDAVFQRDAIRAQLEAEIAVLRENARLRQEQYVADRNAIVNKQRSLEETNARLAEQVFISKAALTQDLELSEQQFYDLQAKPEQDLTLRDFVAMRVFAREQPLRSQIANLQARLESSEQQNFDSTQKQIQMQEAFDAENREHAELMVKYQKASLELVETKQQVQVGNYMIENFDKIKSERDAFETELGDLRTRLQVTETALENAAHDRDENRRELAVIRQTSSLVSSDKDYLNRQVMELQRRLDASEERVHQALQQADQQRSQREDIYERYVRARDEYKSMFEKKLSEELDDLRSKTQLELERLRVQERQVHEIEANTLRDQREQAVIERDRARNAERDALDKFDDINQRYRELQASMEHRIGELAQDLKVKSFEHDRLQLVHQETVEQLKVIQLDFEKTRAKLDTVLKEYGAMQMESEGRIRELERSLEDKADKLRVYEKMEGELDQLVLDAAAIDDPTLAERILANYGTTASRLPTMQKRRLQQAVELARRVLHLERAAARGRADLEAARTRVGELEEQLRQTNALVDDARQPNSYLLESLRERDALISRFKKRIQELEDDARRLEKERSDLIILRNQMSQDLERLLGYAEEVQMLKQLLQLSQSKTQPLDMSRLPPSSSAADHRAPPPSHFSFTNPSRMLPAERGPRGTQTAASSLYGARADARVPYVVVNEPSRPRRPDDS